jgi:hypothetical protein
MFSSHYLDSMRTVKVINDCERRGGLDNVSADSFEHLSPDTKAAGSNRARLG